MTELLVMAVMGLGLYVFVRLILKEPIIPWNEKNIKSDNPLLGNKAKKSPNGTGEAEPEIFRDLFKDMKEISNHLIRYKDDKFVLIAEVTPVNYFLLSQDEQETIDRAFETWLATLNYNVQWYLQNRYIDLSEPIETMQKTMKEQDDLPPNAIHYGNDLIEELIKWQKIAPRYETKRYIVFTHQIKAKDISAEDREELEEKIIDKAFGELYRRFNAAKNALRKAGMDVELLTSEGIVEVLYYAFNRRKALKNKFKDIRNREMLSLYVTADQDERHIELVKEMIENEFNHEEKNDAEKEFQAG